MDRAGPLGDGMAAASALEAHTIGPRARRRCRYGQRVSSRLITTSEGTTGDAFGPREWGLLAVTGLTWGASFLFIAEGLESYEPGAVTFLRVLFGFVTLSMVPRRRTRISGTDLRRVGLLSITWMALPLTLFPIAQNRISSSLAGMINGATPVAVAIVATVLLWRLPGVWQRAGLVAGLTGLLLIGLPSVDEGGNSLVGVLLVVAAVACYGIALNVAVPLQQAYGSLNVLWHVLAIATVLTAPYGVVGLAESHVEVVPTLSLIALGAGGTGLAFVAMATVAGKVGSTRASVTIYLTPPVAIALGVWLRDEAVEPITLVGTVFVLMGAWLAGRPDVGREWRSLRRRP